MYIYNIYIVLVIAKHCIFCMVYKISCECSPIALEFDCSKGYWVHGSAGGISKTHGFPRNIIYKWWVLQIYVSLKEGNYRCWKVIFGQTTYEIASLSCEPPI